MSKRSFFLAAAFVVSAAAVHAQDWPQFRGPARDGSVPAASVPGAWPASFARAWRVDVGEGYASPVVAGGRVFVHSRTDPQEIVTAIDLATGKVLWQQKYTSAFDKNQYARQMAKGPNATPLVAGGRVFTLGVSGVLTAWDAATGRQLWQQDHSARVDSTKLFCGTAASPLLAGGLVIVQVGSDTKGGQMLALDPATGAAKWTWSGIGPGYASPVAIDVAGTAQIATLTQSSVIGADVATGRELWSVPFKDDWNENIVSPVWTGSTLVVSGVRQGTHAITIAKAGPAWAATEAWKNPAVTMYMSTPVVGDGLIYGMSNKQKGQFVALDLKTGALKWASTGRQAEQASILLTPTHVVYLTSGAEMLITRRGAAEFKVEKEYTVADSATWSTPVLLGRDLIVRDATGVMRLTGRP